MSLLGDPDPIQGTEGPGFPDPGSIHQRHLADDAKGVATIEPGTITTEMLEDLIITNAKLDANSVSVSKIQDNAVNKAKIQTNAVGAEELIDATITQAKVAGTARFLTTQNAAIADLAGGADLATTVAKVNAILAALRATGTIAT